MFDQEVDGLLVDYRLLEVLTIAKHLPGKHDQKSHGVRRGAASADKKVSSVQQTKPAVAKPTASKPSETANGVRSDVAKSVKIIGKVSEKNIKRMHDEMSKLPEEIIARLNKTYGKTLVEVVEGRGVSEIPRLARSKGVTPPGYQGTGLTWDDVPACATGGKVAICANRQDETGSKNTLLHEVGHLATNTKNYSLAADWKAIHRSSDWPIAYTQNNPSEAWAEAFSLYYDSEETRAALPQSQREYFGSIDWSK